MLRDDFLSATLVHQVSLPVCTIPGESLDTVEESYPCKKLLCSATKVKANAGLEKKRCVPNHIHLYKILNTLNALVHEVRSMQKCSILFAHSQRFKN